MDAIVTRGLTKDFGAGRGILGLDLVVPEGTVFGFLGPNGAGKTTTLRLLMGFLRPDAGDATLLGQPLHSDRRRLHLDIGYVPGELALPRNERVQAYLDRCATLQGLAKAVDRSWQRELVAELDLPTDRRIRQLSKGNRQKVAIVQALQHQPALLVLDEPTDGLDPVLRRRVGALLRGHADGGGTVFLSSHVVREVETLCDEVAIVAGGRLRHQAAVADLLGALPLRVEVHATRSVADRIQAVLVPSSARVEDLGDDRLRIEVFGDPLRALAELHRLGARDAQVLDRGLEEALQELYDADAGNAQGSP